MGRRLTRGLLEYALLLVWFLHGDVRRCMVVDGVLSVARDLPLLLV